MVYVQTTHSTDTAKDGVYIYTNHTEHKHSYRWCIYKPPIAQTQLQTACRQTTQSTDTPADGVPTTRDKPPTAQPNSRWYVRRKTSQSTGTVCDKGRYSLQGVWQGALLTLRSRQGRELLLRDVELRGRLLWRLAHHTYFRKILIINKLVNSTLTIPRETESNTGRRTRRKKETRRRTKRQGRRGQALTQLFQQIL